MSKGPEVYGSNEAPARDESPFSILENLDYDSQEHETATIKPEAAGKKALSIFNKINTKTGNDRKPSLFARKRLEKLRQQEERIGNFRAPIQRRSYVHFVERIEKHKNDLVVPEIANMYMGAKFRCIEAVDENGEKRHKTALEKIDEMSQLGIPPEQSTKYFAEAWIEQINNPSNDGRELGWTLDGDNSLGELSAAIDKYGLDGLKEEMRESIKAQQFGEEQLGVVLSRGSRSTDDEKRQKEIKRLRDSFAFLRDIGYEPYKNGLDVLFSGFDVTSRQEMANELGLIDGKTVDAMYRQMMDMDIYMSEKNCAISNKLQCSGEDDLAAFLETQNREINGVTELSLIIESAKKEKMPSFTVSMAQYYVDSYTSEKDNPMSSLMEKPDMFNGPDKGFMIALGDILRNFSEQSDEEKKQLLKDAIEKVKNESKDGYKDIFDEEGVTSYIKDYKIFLERGEMNYMLDVIPQLRGKYSEEELSDLRNGTYSAETFNKLPARAQQIVSIYEKCNSDGIDGRKAAEFMAKKKIELLSDEDVEAYIKIFYKLSNSNSDEVQKCFDGILDQFQSFDISLQELSEAVDKIENIFLRNNLPYVGKVFNTFRILYPPDKDFSQKQRSMKREASRGALAELPNRGVRSREAVLWNDLLKASIGSNNRDLKNYLDNLETPDHLRTLADNTSVAKATGGNPNAFEPTSRHTMADRVVRSFAHGLGYETFDQLRKAIDEIPVEADRRNRERLREKDFSLGDGDLVKGTDIEYLGDILQNGIVCKEFLNGQADSDSTPLDSDFGMFSEDFESISDAIDHKNQTNAFGSMHCILVLKSDKSTGRNRFQMEGEGPYDPNKYEIWKNAGENCGIRVGCPSSEIDFIVFDSMDEKDFRGNLNRMKFEIARNGFFIPIVDKKTGEPVFSEEEYDSLRRKMSGLKTYGAAEFKKVPNENMQLDSMDINGQHIPSTDELIAEMQNNRDEVDKKRNAIIQSIIMPVLDERGLRYKPFLDGDITEGSAEVVDTGSTGRYSNTPHDGDFDFMMKLDRAIRTNSSRMSEIRNELLSLMGKDGNLNDNNGNIRAKDVKLDGLDETVDIDITFEQKTNKVQYSTDMALKEYYDSMDSETRQQVVANVVFAKKFFKAINAYKPDRSDASQGGLGGVGIENWIIQNGGSFRQAAAEFMAVAEKCETLDDFRAQYAIFDFGENHITKGVFNHDNFVTGNMNEGGYKKIREALANFLKQYSSE